MVKVNLVKKMDKNDWIGLGFILIICLSFFFVEAAKTYIVQPVNVNEPGFEDLRSPATSVSITGVVNVPQWNSFIGGTQALWFDNGDQVFINAQIPHSRKAGTNLSPHVHWVTDSLVSTDFVTWCIEYVYANIDDEFPLSTVTDCKNQSYLGTLYRHLELDFDEIDGTNITFSNMFAIRLYRGVDTLNDDIALLEFDIHYIADKFGSQNEEP